MKYGFAYGVPGFFLLNTNIEFRGSTGSQLLPTETIPSAGGAASTSIRSISQSSVIAGSDFLNIADRPEARSPDQDWSDVTANVAPVSLAQASSIGGAYR